ncbi:hypothetical protein [Rhodothermus profundi]|uniref:Outer membrane protein beta-barrel domain-containing protein n=1 Tax=Rhodothermus profundi TaxID=633813 RepID=A0A1M6W3G4_9BACT|nr:hypothetical protein [Rhodothermus profundi]SHK88197.1 hypothetical protein SAMN04488087_2222 [Rhodothermus profundi]
MHGLRATLILSLLVLFDVVRAQPVAPDHGRVLQAGIAAVPGLGVQLGYVSPRSIYTVESILYLDVAPSFAGGEGNAQLSMAFGSAFRITGLLRTLGNAPILYDLDVGMRLGPGLLLMQGKTRAQKNQQFGLFLEPFFRFASALGTRHFFFGEVGLHRPFFRAGLWITF